MNIGEVARQARVSVATVSRVINGSRFVKAQKRHQVEEAISLLHYIPDEHAQNLARRGRKGKEVIPPLKPTENFI